MKTFFLFLILLAASTIVRAQVSIGAGEDAVSGAILQLKDIAGITDSTQNANRGLAMPRVQLSNVNQLYPMFLNNPSDSTSGPNANYAVYKDSLDKTHTGLIVYNLTNDANKGLSSGLMQWNGRQWISLSPPAGQGAAIFAELICSNITVNGGFIAGVLTNGQNFLTLTLDVQTTGAYTIIVQSGNGYSFYATGMALNTGALVLTVPAQGMPINPGEDHLIFTGVAIHSGCDPKVEVSGTLAEYSMHCTAITVVGNYLKGTALTPGNYIMMAVTVSVPGSYFITAPLTNGISFSARGTFTATGNQIITLTGSGTPNTNNEITIPITTNSLQGTTTCSVTVPVMAPPMTYAIIGDQSVYAWNNADTRLEALRSVANFSPNGMVKINGFTQLWNATNTTQANNYLTYAPYPDIILYFSYPIYPDIPLARALAAYVQKGGCLIFGAEADNGQASVDGIDTLLVNIFGNWLGTSSPVVYPQIAGTTQYDNDYQISNLPNDPIINGPFGNLCGYYWGEDNESVYSVVVPQMPALSVQVCTAYNPQTKPNVYPTASIVWYNTFMNFVFFGDCGGASMNDTSPSDYPVIYKTGGIPSAKFYGPGGTATAPDYYIYNANLELNAVAWAIKRALTNGINPH